MSGTVIFVGAGPGAADLITLRGARAIASADIVIWASSLVHPDVVAGTKPGAELVDSASASLEDLEPLFVRARDEGLTIARVHTGDPAIYGATAEQRDLIRELGLEFESIPGVSAFGRGRTDGGRTHPARGRPIADPHPPRRGPHADAGARDRARLRGPRHDDGPLPVRRPQQGAAGGTSGRGGYAPDTPCIVGHRVSWPDELMLRCELADLSATMRDHKLWKHTVILVGPALAEGPLTTRSHLYHPGFRHEYRAAEPEAQADLRAHGTRGVGAQA